MSDQSYKLKDGSAITVRKMRRDDGPRIGDMLAACSERTAYFFHPYPLTHESGLKVAADEKLHCLIAFDETGAALGYIWIRHDRDPASLGMVVRDDRQGQGIGRILMERIVAEAKQLGKSGISLTVLHDNHPALKLYRRYGFEVTEERKNEDQTKYIMQRAL
jgi:ribosomal protein S18 acetylase RimI-like enzyme